MKLGFLLFDYFPYGGLQRDCLKIARLCAQRGHDVTLFTRTWQGERPRELRLSHSAGMASATWAGTAPG
jgi:UDP-glucose:(heptosyl)LPS alpha-1,3-glucosyltransferase